MEKGPRYDNSKIIETWAVSGIDTPTKVRECIGITIEEGKEIAFGRVIPSSEVVGRTLEITGKTYDEGAFYFLNPWMLALRKRETARKKSEAMKGRPGRQHSEETRRKMSEAKKGKQHSEETRKKMSEAKLNWWQEKKRSAATSS